MFYTYKCSNCNHQFELKLAMKDREKPLEDKCPSCEKKGTISQIITANYEIVDPLRLGRVKPTEGHRSRMNQIAKNNPGHNMRTW